MVAKCHSLDSIWHKVYLLTRSAQFYLWLFLVCTRLQQRSPLIRRIGCSFHGNWIDFQLVPSTSLYREVYLSLSFHKCFLWFSSAHRPPKKRTNLGKVNWARDAKCVTKATTTVWSLMFTLDAYAIISLILRVIVNVNVCHSQRRHSPQTTDSGTHLNDFLCLLPLSPPFSFFSCWNFSLKRH